MVARSLSTHLCPICFTENKYERLEIKYADDNDCIKVCQRCGFQAHFIKH